MSGYSNILVAVDLSEESAEVAEKARDLASKYGAQLHIIHVIEPLSFAYGGDIYDYEAGQFTYDTPEAVEALTFLQRLTNEGCIAQAAEKYGDQTDFGNGKALLIFGSSAGLPFISSAV